MFKITSSENVIEECKKLIVVPVKALEEHGYIQTLAENHENSAKHEFHAMAQMAYFQYQDDELTIIDLDGDVLIESTDMEISIDSGLILCRKEDGSFVVLVHKDLNTKKLLEAAYRFCTRWIRLDI